MKIEPVYFSWIWNIEVRFYFRFICFIIWELSVKISLASEKIEIEIIHKSESYQSSFQII